jgi:uncharacterized membrane protein
MAKLVYATFADAARAESGADAIAELRRAVSVVIHAGTVLDGDRLQDSATEYGRNIALSTAAGAAFFMVAGIVTSLSGIVVGMGVPLGAAMGIIVGVFMGGLVAMQAGTRVAKKELREVARELTPGGRLLTVEVDSRETQEAVMEALHRNAALVVGTC